MAWKLLSYSGANIQLNTWTDKQEENWKKINCVLDRVYSQNSQNEET